MRADTDIIRVLIAVVIAFVVFWLLSYVHVILAALVAVILFLAIVMGRI